MLPQWRLHQTVRLQSGELTISGTPAAAAALAS
jgi:hypothetical protein